MIDLILLLGVLATLTQCLGVLYARHTAMTWQGSEMEMAVAFSQLPFEMAAWPLAALGLLLGLIKGIWMLKTHDPRRRRSLGRALALCLLGMVPFGMFGFTWRDAQQRNIREHQADPR